MTSINDGEWPLPPAGPEDDRLREKLMETGGSFHPGTRWNIDCMERVVAPALDAHGLLDGPAPWLEIRRSRSEMAGGVTVEFAPHPDETDQRFLKMRHFRFRQQRMTKSQEALRDMHAAAERRAFLMRRRAAIDAGLLPEAQAVICDAILPHILQALGLDLRAIAITAARQDEITYGTSPSGDGQPQVQLQRRESGLEAVRVMLDDATTSRGASGDATLVVRGLSIPEEDIEAQIGRSPGDVLDRDELRVPGVTVTGLRCRGDTAIIQISRPRDTLMPIPE